MNGRMFYVTFSVTVQSQTFLHRTHQDTQRKKAMTRNCDFFWHDDDDGGVRIVLMWEVMIFYSDKRPESHKESCEPLHLLF
jgi:hypothetical protein